MSVRILVGDVREQLRTLPDESVHCVVTSPPYFGLRDYGCAGQIGLESTPAEFVSVLVDVFRVVRRVLRDDGTLWLNLGDSYGTGTTAARQSGSRGLGSGTGNAQDAVPRVGGLAKQLFGIPWRVAFALQADGWYLRQDIIWHKPNPMPESVQDRCTKSHEYIFLLTKSERYFYDAGAIAELSSGQVPGNVNATKSAQAFADGDEKHRTKSGLTAYANRQRSKRNSFARETKESSGENGQKPQHRADRDDIDYAGTRNKRSVWSIATRSFSEAHFATFPPELPETCIKAGCPVGGVVLDPFFGAGTTGLVADRLQRDCIGIELNPEYAAMAHRRIFGDSPLFADVVAA